MVVGSKAYYPKVIDLDESKGLLVVSKGLIAETIEQVRIVSE